MLSVKSFFFDCASLENFGIVYGWYSLVMTVIVGVITCSGTAFLVLDDVRFGLVVLVEFSYLGFFVYFIIDFIKGIKQKNHRRMTAFRNLCIATSILYSLLLLVASGFYSQLLMIQNKIQKLYSELELENKSFVESRPTVLIILLIVYVAWTIYCSVCVTSLYLEMKDKILPVGQPGPSRDAMTHYVVNYQAQPIAPQDISIKF